MQPNADLARVLYAPQQVTLLDLRVAEVAGVAACRPTGKRMPERNEMDVRDRTSRSDATRRIKVSCTVHDKTANGIQVACLNGF